MFTAILLIIAAYVIYKLTGHLPFGPNGFSFDSIADRLIGSLWPQRRVRRIAHHVLDAVHRQVMIGVRGTVLVPDRIEVGLAESDYAVIAPATEWFTAEVAGAVDALTVKRGWTPHGPVTVTVSCVPNAVVGRPDVTSRFTRKPTATQIAIPDRYATSAADGVGRTAAAAGQLAHGTQLVVIPVGGETTVGRDDSEGCQLIVDDVLVSRRHAGVRSRNGILEVRDLSSSNGTFVNDVRITDVTRVVDGDVIRVGSQRIIVRCPDGQSTQRITDNLARPQRTTPMGR